MKATLFLGLALFASAAHADPTLLITFGDAGRTVVARSSHMSTSGADGSIELTDVYQDSGASASDMIERDGFDPAGSSGSWSWRFHSKAGTEEGSATCIGHTETSGGSGGGGAYVWLECEL